jgi:hypothetical protein
VQNGEKGMSLTHRNPLQFGAASELIPLIYCHARNIVLLTVSCIVRVESNVELGKEDWCGTD